MTPLPAALPDGVRLWSDRAHVSAKLAATLGSERPEIAGGEWRERFAEALSAFTFSERGALNATILGHAAGASMQADEALERVRTPWLPELLDSGRLYPHFQPIVALDTGRVHGYESLIRGRVGGQELNGGQIVGAARAHQALFNLDQRGRAVALEHGLPVLPPDTTLFVNFTPSAIYDPDICLRTTWAIARRLGFPLSRVCFEVVETERFPDVDFLLRILDRYRAEGARVALDDLGAGHSSLSYLRLLRPDVVKLDRELVSGIDGDLSRQRLLSSLLDYAHELEIDVVAEGIETEAELAIVRELGADLGQGWYLGRPAAEPRPVDPALVTAARAPGAARARPVTLRDRALAAATSGVAIADATQPDHPIVYVNPAFERLTGYSAEDIVGRNCRMLQGAGTDPAAVAEMGAGVREHREVRVTVQNYRKDGTPFWSEVHLAPVRDEAGEVVQYIGVQNDVTARVDAENELRHLADHDPLTGLPNRAALHRRAQELLRSARPVALLFVDVDDFKGVNDDLGHECGDVVLCRIADRLRAAAGPDAFVARHAGDEFVVLLADGDELGGHRVATAVEAALDEPLEVAGGTRHVGASVGVATFPGDAADFAALLRHADGAMYGRKAARRAAA